MSLGTCLAYITLPRQAGMHIKTPGSAVYWFDLSVTGVFVLEIVPPGLIAVPMLPSIRCIYILPT